ncbi:MAG: sugar ABC transporter permease [Paracoccus sp. (in: a-proteobacteria)]|nr:sugar ABC transporter permease [Paracoccus sp. (in: a-proteobacteria)]
MRALALPRWVLFVLPALMLIGIYLVWPALETLRLSFYAKRGEGFVGLGNYIWLAGQGAFREAIRNNLLWLLIVPFASTALGLLAAELSLRISWGWLARLVIFMPIAISFVGAAVIWKLVFEHRPDGAAQIGALNALVQALGGSKQLWLALPGWNNLLLMAVMIWTQTGFAMVLLTAALRAVPAETIEAARLDGASARRVFFDIKLPQIRGVLALVWVAIAVMVLKIFDLVFVMTGGQWGTQVLANLLYDFMFRGTPDYGRGSAVAVVLMALVAPVMVLNIRWMRRGGV